MTEFTPLSAFAGGTIIGIATVMLLWLNGRIAGISGILAGAFSKGAGERTWRLLFVFGLVGGGLVYRIAGGDSLVPAPGVSPALLVAAGLLVGAGTRLGNGCTSGHGVCGVSRLSSRSLAATATFLAAGVITATSLGWLNGAGA